MKAGGLQTVETIAALWGINRKLNLYYIFIQLKYKNFSSEGVHKYRSEVEGTSHVITKADGVDDLLLWGDDFEDILDILEGD